MGTLGDVKDLAILGALGVGGLLIFKFLKTPEAYKEPKGTVDPYAYRGTDLQEGLAGALQGLVGFGPGWLGQLPTGAGGMRYYGLSPQDRPDQYWNDTGIGASGGSGGGGAGVR